uniref:Uncharacterized protein n=1 Tax=Arundo donax TaxID=35708 RepID=A0A0A9FPU1_ARUDO
MCPQFLFRYTLQRAQYTFVYDKAEIYI